jgi:hypothetical protein
MWMVYKGPLLPWMMVQSSRAGCGHGVQSPVLYLEWLYKGPEQDADGVTLSEEFDESGSAEQTQESHIEEVFLRILAVLKEY